MQHIAHAHLEGDSIHVLRTLPPPPPPPWLRARVMAEVAAIEQQRHARRVRWRRYFALALLVQFGAYAATERVG